VAEKLRQIIFNPKRSKEYFMGRILLEGHEQKQNLRIKVGKL